MDKWGVGPALADVLMAHYGGHVLMTKDAINLLARIGDRFDPTMVPDSNHLRSGIAECLENQSQGRRMRDTLEQMARRGFCPVGKVADPVEGIISEQNVGGVVRDSGTTPGLSDEVWAGASYGYGVVPTSSWARLMIGLELSATPLSTWRGAAFARWAKWRI